LSGRASAHARASPFPAQRWAGFASPVGSAPLDLVAVDVAADLRGPGAERADELGQLGDLAAVWTKCVTVCGKRGTEARIGYHRGVPDAVDRAERVADADCVQASPPSFGENASVDLQVQMSVRIACARGVMAHGDSVDLGDRYLDLRAARADPRRRVLREPADNLPRCAFLSRVVCGGDVGVQFGGKGPRLGSVDDNFHEPDRICVGAQPALRRARIGVETGYPGLVVVTRQRCHVAHAVGV
jgi:hypothetical protein